MLASSYDIIRICLLLKLDLLILFAKAEILDQDICFLRGINFVKFSVKNGKTIYEGISSNF
jgi:hypothetical protein